MDGRQPNPFQVRDREQPWSFNRLNEALPNQFSPVPHRAGPDNPAQSNQFLPGTHRRASPTSPTRQIPLLSPPDGPVRGTAAGRQRSSQSRYASPPSDRFTWHNPLGRNQEALRPRSYQRNATQVNVNGDPARPATGPGPSQQPLFVLGTREEVQSEDYVSPLATMYGRAWNRYREAEENRAADREAIVNAATVRTDPLANVLDLLGSSPPQQSHSGQFLAESMEIRRRASRQETRERIARLQEAQERIQQLHEAQDQLQQLQQGLVMPTTTPRANPIDIQRSRPPPVPSEEMIANIECRICHEQKMDTLLEPCMHLAICHWCSEVMHNRNRLYRVDPENGDAELKCPICRRKVTQVRRIFVVL